MNQILAFVVYIIQAIIIYKLIMMNGKENGGSFAMLMGLGWFIIIPGIILTNIFKIDDY